MTAGTGTPRKQGGEPFAPEPDADLAKRFHSGEPEAMERIAALFFTDVRRYAMTILRDEELAHEALQDTFLRLVERHPLYQPGRPFRPWLFAVCRNCCLTHLRLDQRDRARTVSLQAFDEETLDAAAGSSAEEELLLRREQQAEALALLAPLSELNKSIVMLHLFEDLTFREVAAIVELPAATVATTYYRTLAEMRKTLANGSLRMEGRGNGNE